MSNSWFYIRLISWIPSIKLTVFYITLAKTITYGTGHSRLQLAPTEGGKHVFGTNNRIPSGVYPVMWLNGAGMTKTRIRNRYHLV